MPLPTVARPRLVAALAAAALVAVAGCSNNAEAPAAAPSAAPGAGSSVTAREPDVNGDGVVKIGVLSPGDLNDHGYYESFVTSAKKFTDEHGWQLIQTGMVNPADALEQARNMCRQGVDMVALGASELADAIPASTEPVCANTAWYVPAQGNVAQTPQITISSDDVNESLFVGGFAMGMLMQDRGATSAGFVTGPQADFSVAAAKAFKAGIRKVVPNANLLTTYTGDFNNSALAVEATKAQVQQGVGALYPYLGGATDAAAQVGFTAGIPVATPGTDRCAENTYAVSVIFDPGVYFGAALQDFADKKLVMGQKRTWHMGKDPVPTVKLCKGTPEQNQKLADLITGVGNGSVNLAATVAELGS